MKIDLMDIERLIRTNGLEGKEVTNPILFEAGNIPTPDGMLSLELFGMTSKERKENYAYVNLHDYFLHPYVYKILLRLDRKIEAVVKGTRNFIINQEGQLVEDENNGENGCAWLIIKFLVPLTTASIFLSKRNIILYTYGCKK